MCEGTLNMYMCDCCYCWVSPSWLITHCVFYHKLHVHWTSSHGDNAVLIFYFKHLFYLHLRYITHSYTQIMSTSNFIYCRGFETFEKMDNKKYWFLLWHWALRMKDLEGVDEESVSFDLSYLLDSELCYNILC